LDSVVSVIVVVVVDADVGFVVFVNGGCIRHACVCASIVDFPVAVDHKVSNTVSSSSWIDVYW
jgi:hypothetical protein